MRLVSRAATMDSTPRALLAATASPTSYNNHNKRSPPATPSVIVKKGGGLVPGGTALARSSTDLDGGGNDVVFDLEYMTMMFTPCNNSPTILSYQRFATEGERL